MWGVYPEDGTCLKVNFFSYLALAGFEKSLKNDKKNHDFENSRFKSGFTDFSPKTTKAR